MVFPAPVPEEPLIATTKFVTTQTPEASPSSFDSKEHRGKHAFPRRGVVEGFFGPPWSMSHRARLFEFGARRGLNTYLYAPKDDPYHRERWKEPYPGSEWRKLLGLIRLAQAKGIDFVYGFHPGRGLKFSSAEPLASLLGKAELFYDAGVRTFAVLFDDIPSRLEHREDRKRFADSLAAAEAAWLEGILEKQPAAWRHVAWWLCPSYYTEDPLLAERFGPFEPFFLEKLAQRLPEEVACLWTGPQVVSKEISLAHVEAVRARLRHRLILWDNYPVNDLAMSSEMHLSPLTGRDPRLPEAVYGYLNNPLLQETLSLIPLATCFDYAANPGAYDPEESWENAVRELFGDAALPCWRTLRNFCEEIQGRKRLPGLDAEKRSALRAAYRYVLANRHERWFEEFKPWLKLLRAALAAKKRRRG